ncbi:CAP domain-containing protein [Pedobacter kyungheensis]|uniref:CAP domain-containing protein n=1 Tax=Pedobacter kyungheensis TaxID=1069985 RepID=UPI00068DA059|nr:CAP domain-containing protein [Pedobacter kyungheensis]
MHTGGNTMFPPFFQVIEMKNWLIIFWFLLLGIALVQCKKDELTEPKNEVVLLVGKINLLRQSGCNCGTIYMPPVPPLSVNMSLQAAATAHAKDMAQKNYFDHLSPEGGTPEERVINAGYTGEFIAENLAKGYSKADEVVAAWKNSTSHCKAMMDAKSKEAGVGMAQNYWAVSFGASR